MALSLLDYGKSWQSDWLIFGYSRTACNFIIPTNREAKRLIIQFSVKHKLGANLRNFHAHKLSSKNPDNHLPCDD